MAHSIVVSLLLATGSFETDAKRAERALLKMQKQAAAAGKVIGGVLAAGATAAVYAFDQLVKSAADFQDMSEMTGASAEDLASLAVAAGTAGVEMQTLAGNSIRLTKSLTGVDDESKAAGAAIAALGLDLKGFKQLDPVAQIDALTVAFGEFADGPKKSAVAVALWGKSGAEMLKLMKALEEQGGRTKILTKEQITAADAYADAQARATTELGLYAQALATEAAPAFTAVIEATSDFIKALIGVDEQTGKLKASTDVKDFAAAAARSFAFLIDMGDGVVRVFRGIGLTIGAMAAATAAVASGEFKQAKLISDAWEADMDAIANRKFFGQLVEERLGQPAPAGAPRKKELKFEGATSKADGKAAREADAYIANLKKQLDATKDLTVVEQVRTDLQDKRFKSATEAQKAEMLALAQQIDTATELKNQHEKDNEALTAQNKLVQERAEAAKQLAISVEAPIETLNRELAELEELARTNPFLSGEVLAKLDAAAWKRFADATKDATDKVDEFGKKMAENIQDVLAGGLYDAMTGNFKNIGRGFADMLLKMVAQAQAADLARAIFGTDSKGNLSGGWLAQLGSTFGTWLSGSSAPSAPPVGGSGTITVPATFDLAVARAGGGPVSAGSSYLVGERGPELFQPYSSGNVLPNDMLGQRSGSQVQVINNLGVQAQPTVEQRPDGMMRIVLNSVAEDTRRGGVTARATAGRFGVNNGATLNRRRG